MDGSLSDDENIKYALVINHKYRRTRAEVLLSFDFNVQIESLGSERVEYPSDNVVHVR